MDALAWLGKGEALENLERHEEALETISRAIGLDPENPLAWYNKGMALINLGRHEEALETISKTIELYPENAPAWIDKWMTLVNLRRYKEALDTLSRAIELSLEALSKAVELNPEDIRAWHLKGQMHLVASVRDFKRSNYGNALEAINSAINAFDTFTTFSKDKEKAKEAINDIFMAFLRELINAKDVETLDMALLAVFEKKKELKELFEPISTAVEIVKSRDVSKYYELQVERREVVADIVKKLTGSEELLPE